MPVNRSEVLVGRRYLDRGFVDAAKRLFLRNRDEVDVGDWGRLADRLLEQNRVTEVVEVCQIGGVPVPQARILELADRQLRRRDMDGAIRLYELAEADEERWLEVLDVLTAVPDRHRQAVAIVERHLDGAAERTQGRRIRAVK